MCTRTVCSRCDRPTYAGCGQHVEQVLGDVDPRDRCQCDTGGGGGTSLIRRFFGA